MLGRNKHWEGTNEVADCCTSPIGWKLDLLKGKGEILVYIGMSARSGLFTSSGLRAIDWFTSWHDYITHHEV